MNTKSKKIVFWVSLAVLIIFLLDILFVIFTPTKIIESNLFEASDNLMIGYTLKKDSVFLMPPFNDFMQTNRLGFRDEEWTVSDKKVVALVGDSVALGQGIDQEEKIDLKLEEAFPEYNFMNFGVSAYDLTQEIEIIKKYTINYNPETVIIIYSINDIFPDNNVVESLLTPNQLYKRNNLMSKDLSLNCKLKLRTQNILSRSFLFHRMNSANFGENMNLRVVNAYNDECNLERITNSMDDLQTLSEEHDFDVVFVIMPMLLQTEFFPYSDIYNLLKEESNNRGFTTITLSEEFSKEKESKLRANYQDTSHPSVYANNILIEKIDNLGLFQS